MYNPIAQKYLQDILSKENWNAPEDQTFVLRLTAVFHHLYGLYERIYGARPEWQHELAALVRMLRKKFDQRPAAMKRSDLAREQNPDWFTSERLAGMMLYADLFNNDLKGVEDKIPYLESLGINLLHLMPLFESPREKNDGGYAVSDYRKVDARFGTNKDLKSLAGKLHKKDMYLMLDLVINHTSDEHAWAAAARKGERDFQEYYYMFSDRTIPDLFENSLPEIFPENAPGNFTYVEEIDKWVMTVFNHYQWDLNYTNPKVLEQMTAVLLDVANMGVDIFRMDAVAFLWKKMGTNSQNLEEAHILLKIMKSATQVVAPGVAFLAEAIVAPQEILRYFGNSSTWSDECDLAYNATLMALMWDALCTRNARIMRNALANLPHKPEGTTWISYLRCHDDIGLGYDNTDIEMAGYTPDMHRKFIVDYLTGEFEGSFARGLPFMANPETGDARISGSMASLAGLEKALEENDQKEIRLSIKRILMMHGVIIAYSGIPMIYYGDEIATLNDYSFVTDTRKQDDNRWIHRPRIDWKRAERRKKKDTPEYQVFNGLAHMLRLRKEFPVMADRNNIILPEIINEHVLAFARTGSGMSPILIVANLTETEQYLETAVLFRFGMDSHITYDLLSGEPLQLESKGIRLTPYEILWLTDRK